ncbi:MAG: cytochrome c biogenesis protein CcsA [Bacteroidetes bacterium]|nr:cytochrome c biogenesis protein CcsA [Bacteroidota bacterium]
MTYTGEHIWAGQLGHGFVILSFVAALMATIGYYFSSKEQLTHSWKRFADIFFSLHSVAVLGIACTLFYMLFNHFYEYSYVWQHSNNSMPMQYILSCFWEGQEGSFLLWTFWNVVLGNILKRSLKYNQSWEAPVMLVFSLVQVFLASMLLGIYFGDYKLGSSPFLLLRENPEFSNLPFVQNANYLAKLDGRGLNPLLMNYWMVIHPPTLFLGFSSTLVPFAFAIAGLWRRDYTGWQKTALPWSFFSVAILGTGILMGGAWAYEALSFNGFWAWDPVENSSLVPWLVVVGAAHVMIVNKNKGGSLFTTHLLSVSSFLLVLYSTFLTRSGILGNTSVHAFTDLGMQGQLVIYVLTFIFLFVTLLIHDSLLKVSYIVLSLILCYFGILYGYKKVLFFTWIIVSTAATVWTYIKDFPKEKNEEELFSREFWMFIGALLLLLSSIVITYFTSIPVVNKLFNANRAPVKIADYNLWQIPFAIIIILLVAVTQFFKYKRTDTAQFYKNIRWSMVISVVAGLVCCIPLYFVKDYKTASTEDRVNYILYSLLFISAIFAILANADYWVRILKGKIRHAGASIAHIGFAMILLGALISTSKRQTISQNTSKKQVERLGENFNAQKSLVLTLGDTLPLGPYMVTYTGKKREGIDVYFHMDYLAKSKAGKLEKVFDLSPMIEDNPRMGKASNPDTKHFLGRDIYTHVTYADLSEPADVDKDAYKEPTNFVGHMHDTIPLDNSLVVIDSLLTNLSEQEYRQNDSLLIITAVLRALDIDGHVYKARPKYIVRKNMIDPQEAVIPELGLKFIFWKINPEQGSVEIQISEKVGNTKDFIVLEAYMFPFINVLWAGCIVMVIGTVIAIRERFRLRKISQA